MTFRSNLQQIRQSRHMIARILVVGLAVVFYLALVPLALLFSGPVYRALQCQFGDCRQPGTEATFVLESRGALRIGSSVRFPNGLEIGRVVGFTPTGDERYIESTVLFAPDYAYLLDQPLRCQVTANFNLDM
ncbi:MAG: hypothetical protein JW797_17215, partial [Bradymonadales bacterium]|nr:hypothetical protein [Bradymonadales bacterium]